MFSIDIRELILTALAHRIKHIRNKETVPHAVSALNRTLLSSRDRIVVRNMMFHNVRNCTCS